MPKIVRTELIQALARVEPGRSTKSFIEQSACYVFFDGWVATFNDEVCCRSKSGLPADIRGAVQGKPLKDVLDNMSDDEIAVDVVGNEFQVSGARKKSGIRLQAEIVLPIDTVDSPEEWIPFDNPDEFAEAVKQVCSAAGTDAEEFVAACVHLTPDYMEASDRKSSAMRYDTPVGVTRKCLVRAKSLVHVGPLGVTKMGETESWLHFRNKLVCISVRRQMDDYMDTAQLWQTKGRAAELPKGAKEAAKLGGIFSSEDAENNKVVVRLSEGQMIVRGDGAHGWATAQLEMAYHGPEVAFRISPEVLAELVQKHNRCEISENKLIVRGERWTFISVLGRVDPAAQSPVREVEPADEEELEAVDA